METLYRKVQFEINHKEHDEIWLIGKSANFIFNPNTRNGEELFNFLSCCEETPDNTQQIEKLEADKVLYRKVAISEEPKHNGNYHCIFPEGHIFTIPFLKEYGFHDEFTDCSGITHYLEEIPDPTAQLKADNEKLLEAVNEYEPDLIVLAGFLVVIPPEMIAAYRNRMINIHPSLIPAFCGKGYYGLKVHEAALARGVKVVGATVHFVDEGTDTGPIILQQPVMTAQEDTPEILQKRVMEQAEWKILPKAIDLIANEKVHVKEGRVIIDGYRAE